MKTALLALISLLFLWLAAAADSTRDTEVVTVNAQQAGNSVDAGSPGEGPSDVEVVVRAPECCCNQCPDLEASACLPAGLLEFHGPLAVGNQHPTTALFLVPIPTKASVLADGESYLQFKLDLTNNIIRELDNGIIVDMDFENLRATFDYRQGIGGGELSVQVPVISRTHGFLDGLITDWHKWFGLPNGLRNTFPDFQYRYTIASRQGLAYNGSGDVFGLGDITLIFKKPLFEHDSGNALAWRAGLKLPTGDSDKALGSGNFDGQIGGIYEYRFNDRLRGYANVDYVFVGAPDWDNVGHQDIIVSLWALEYAVHKNTTVVGQYRTHRNPLRVGSKEADKDAQELSLGFHHRLSDKLVWSGGFSEDLAPETAPDFVVMSHFLWEL